MAPYPKGLEARDEKGNVEPQEGHPGPSTWQVISAIGGSLWFSYLIYSNASQIWKWVASKFPKKKEAVEEDQKLQRRTTKPKELGKRWDPFSGFVNVVYWVQRVVRWIYHQADMIPVRIQSSVDRKYTKAQDAEWEDKEEEAEEAVKTIMASQFPDYYRKKYLEPFEEDTEDYLENLELLDTVQPRKGRRREYTVAI